LKILLTNDDGYDAEGLQCLYALLSQKHECVVVAPDRGRSCCSQAVTTGEPMSLHAIGTSVWSLSGTPADCVRVALLHLGIRPDLVISGVNHGGNLGVDIIYSGTVAAAREACLMGVPSIAISQYMKREITRDWNVTASRALYVLETVLQKVLPPKTFWNINLPALPPERVEMDFQIRFCEPETQSLDFSFEVVPNAESPGQESAPPDVELIQPNRHMPASVLYKSNYQQRPRSPGTDVDLCFQGDASVSQLGNFPTLF
jgi:5'-nucleotidase